MEQQLSEKPWFHLQGFKVGHRAKSSGQDGWSQEGKTPALNALWALHWKMKQVVSMAERLMGEGGETSLGVSGVHLGSEYLTVMHLALVVPRKKKTLF